MAVRAILGLAQMSAATVIAAYLAWSFFPELRASTTPPDFLRAVLTTLLWLPGPYSVAALFETVLAEPLSFVLLVGRSACCCGCCIESPLRWILSARSARLHP